MTLVDRPNLMMSDTASQAMFFQWIADGISHLDKCLDEAKKKVEDQTIIVATDAKVLNQKIDKQGELIAAHLLLHQTVRDKNNTIMLVLSTQWKLIGTCLGVGAVLGKFGHGLGFW